MPQKLIIVESPAKAKTITKILGKGYTVKASVGHIRDLESSGRGDKAFGIDIKDHFKPRYKILPGKEKVIEDLKKAAQKADEIYLAPDPDREGEAIAWHLKEVLEIADEKTKRITYQAVTAKAVKDALDNPKNIDMNLVNAQQARRILDRLVGFRLSPFLWKKVAKNLSAGRVQSVALKIVVSREAEIDKFVAVEYWKVEAIVSPTAKPHNFNCKLVKWKDEKFDIGTPNNQAEQVKAMIAILEKETYRIAGIDRKKSESKPPAPFITSTLQQAASTTLGFSPERTMRIAQQLYEGVDLQDGPEGLITYMRTDSTRIASEGLTDARDYIAENYAAEYLPAKANFFGSKKNTQDAHEAIRPYHVKYTPEFLKSYLKPEQYKLYRLIWNRFVASQMTPAVFNITTYKIEANQALFEAKGRELVSQGHMIVGGLDTKDKTKYQDLPSVQENDALTLEQLDHEQHFTTPPPRYSEAGLIKALEKEGIGRPSTYAPIIQTLKERGYALLKDKAFHPSELGKVVTQILDTNFSNVMSLRFTANMEEKLDEVEHGNNSWVELLEAFYTPFDQEVIHASEHVKALKGQPYEGEERCPLCGKELVIRYSKKGAFLSCSAYPECNGILSMPNENELQSSEDYPPCSDCGSIMLLKTSRFGKQFLACSSYPECKHTEALDQDGQIVELPKIERDCDLCAKPMIVKVGRRGPFLACSDYPTCKNTMAISKDGKPIEVPKLDHKEVCEKCGEEMVVKIASRGPFLACSGFPKCRNTKSFPPK